MPSIFTPGMQREGTWCTQGVCMWQRRLHPEPDATADAQLLPWPPDEVQQQPLSQHRHYNRAHERWRGDTGMLSAADYFPPPLLAGQPPPPSAPPPPPSPPHNLRSAAALARAARPVQHTSVQKPDAGHLLRESAAVAQRWDPLSREQHARPPRSIITAEQRSPADVGPALEADLQTTAPASATAPTSGSGQQQQPSASEEGPSPASGAGGAQSTQPQDDARTHPVQQASAGPLQIPAADEQRSMSADKQRQQMVAMPLLAPSAAPWHAHHHQHRHATDAMGAVGPSSGGVALQAHPEPQHSEAQQDDGQPIAAVHAAETAAALVASSLPHVAADTGAFAAESLVSLMPPAMPAQADSLPPPVTPPGAAAVQQQPEAAAPTAEQEVAAPFADPPPPPPPPLPDATTDAGVLDLLESAGIGVQSWGLPQAHLEAVHGEASSPATEGASPGVVTRVAAHPAAPPPAPAPHPTTAAAQPGPVPANARLASATAVRSPKPTARHLDVPKPRLTARRKAAVQAARRVPTAKRKQPTKKAPVDDWWNPDRNERPNVSRHNAPPGQTINWDVVQVSLERLLMNRPS